MEEKMVDERERGEKEMRMKTFCVPSEEEICIFWLCRITIWC